jgi:hypothetical protein
VLDAVGAMGPASTAKESSTPSERESDDVGADAADARADCEPRLDEEPTLELRADAEAAPARRDDDRRARGGIVEVSEGGSIT